MSKELEAFSKEKQALDELYDVAGNIQNLKEDYIILKTALKRLESIDNSNPSEALECLKHIKKYYIPEPCSAKTYDCLETIKQALLKAQEPKHYLKWEDLEFKIENQEMFVLLNGSCYLLEYYTDSETEYVIIKATNTTMFALEGDWIDDIQFFNDLRLERVEE